jgi:predicted nicotinamide N-methyase
VGNDNEDDDDDVGVGDFFAAASRRFVTRTYAFGDVSQQLECSEAASTDFDQTGQIVWPSARLLAHFVAARLRHAALAGEDVLELGAGCGLTGLVATHFAPRSVTLTDNEPEVLAILSLNAARHAARGVDCRCADLDWGRPAAHARLAAASGGRERWRVVLAADVVYWRESIAPLFDSVAALLAPREGRFYLGYFERAASNTRELFAAAAARGLVCEASVAPADFLPQPPPPDLASHHELMAVHIFRLAGGDGDGDGDRRAAEGPGAVGAAGGLEVSATGAGANLCASAQ